MELETARLHLRPWLESDAKDLYEYAKDPLVGPIAGWPIHTSVENSLAIIQNVLAKENTYAIVLKKTNKVIGSIGIMIGKQSTHTHNEEEGEIGYWIGVPYWGQGLMPEAVRELQRYAFKDLHLKALWCGYYDGNLQSKRVQEKCGFQYHHRNDDVECALVKETRKEYINYLSKDNWQATIDQ